jgi:hypothetical protein
MDFDLVSILLGISLAIAFAHGFRAGNAWS